MKKLSFEAMQNGMPMHEILEGVMEREKSQDIDNINRNVKKQIGVNYAIHVITLLGEREMN